MKKPDIEVYVVFFVMSRGFYLWPNRCKVMNFRKATNKNWTYFVICTNIPTALAPKLLKRIMSFLQFLHPNGMSLTSQLVDISVSNSM